jgi:hypothetical protein
VCGADPVHIGNLAHSVSGYGLIVSPPVDNSQLDCAEFSSFNGYKNRMATMHMGGGVKAKKSIVADIVAIDSGTGLMAFGGKDDGRVEVKTSTFYGSYGMLNKDCPDSETSNCGQCIPKAGV